MSAASASAKGLSLAALIFQILIAAVVTLAAIAFAVLVPTLGGLEGGDGGPPEGQFSIQGLGFSPVDAVLTLFVGFALLFWAWVALDLLFVVRPLNRDDVLSAEGPALLLGFLQLAGGGVIPGVLLIAASRRMRDQIRSQPELEAARSNRTYLPRVQGRTLSRVFARGAMVGFGVLWGIAGFEMFQNQFSSYLPTLIRIASQGAPSFLGGWFHFWIFVSSLGGSSVADVAGSLQLVLAFCLIVGFARKIAFLAGMLGAIFLWVVPEAFGGPFTVGAFSLGPGVVYATGLLGLIALNATYGEDLGTLDRLLIRRFPRWGRLSEVAWGLVPQIGRWYVRNSQRLTRSFELTLGAVLAASAAVALAYHFDHDLTTVLTARDVGASGPWRGWFTFWGSAAREFGPAIAGTVIAAELGVASLLVLGLGRKVAGFVGLGLSLFVWIVVESAGGLPGPGYTDPGVGIAEAFAFVCLLAVVALPGRSAATLDGWTVRRFPAWGWAARFTRE